MPDILVRVTCSPGEPGEYIRTADYFTGNPLDPWRTETTATFACEAFEMESGTELFRVCGPPADPEDAYGTLTIVRYTGSLSYAADDPLPNDQGCLIDTSTLLLTNPPTVTVLGNGQYRIDVLASSQSYPLTFTLAGQNPVIITAPGAGDITKATFLVSKPGKYIIGVFDGADSNKNFEPVVIGGGGDYTGEQGVEKDLLSYVYERSIGDGQGGQGIFDRIGFAYDKGSRVAVPFTFVTLGPAGQEYSRPVKEEVDRYLLADNLTLRRVFHNGMGGIRFEDTAPEAEQAIGELELLNLIKTDIDEAGTDTGRVWIEADSPALPITHMLNGQTNETGQFQNLPAGLHAALLTDAAGRTLTVQFTIEDRYRLRWQVLTDDLEGEAVEVYILEQDYEGEAESVCAGGLLVQRGWEGIGSDPLAPFAEVLGGTAKLTLRTSVARQFEDMSLSHDRKHRVDVRRTASKELVFRGYVAPETYREPLLAPGQEVSVLAGDGLGSLTDTEFLNHLGRQMRGRRPVFSTILHCLSRTDTNLPVYVAANLREVRMNPASEPLLEAWGQRTAYGTDEQKAATCRQVLEALLRPHFIQLSQRDGAWRLEAIPEIDAPAQVRQYSMEGLPLPVPARPEPLHIVPSQDATGANDVFWLTAAQMLELTPAAAAVVATVKLQLEENQLQNGDFQLWTPVLDRPQGWALANGYRSVYRVNADKVGQYWLDLRPTAVPDAGLTSSPVRNLAGEDAAPLRLSLTARAMGLPTLVGEPAPEKRLIRQSVQLLINGVPEPETIDFEFESGAKMETQETLLPNGLPAGQLRVQLLAPVLVSGPAGTEQYPVRLLLESVKLAIIPAARQWPESDSFTALNASRGYVLLPPVELAHADIPRLALPSGLPANVAQMNTDAWRHGLSLLNRDATEEWTRPGQPVTDAKPLLETVAAERMELRTVPLVGMAGVVRGAAVWRIGIGTMLDCVDVEGKFVVVSCQHEDQNRQATIVVRRLRSGSYTAENDVPARVRINQLGYRINQLGYRVV